MWIWVNWFTFFFFEYKEKIWNFQHEKLQCITDNFQYERQQICISYKTMIHSDFWLCQCLISLLDNASSILLWPGHKITWNFWNNPLETAHKLGEKLLIIYDWVCQWVVQFSLSRPLCLPMSNTITWKFEITYMYMLLKSKRHSLRCHDFLVHAYLLRMCNVVDFRVMRRLCHREWNWQRNWQSVNQHSWDPWQWTTWSRRMTSGFNSVLDTEYK